ncbi:MAG TPA: hypothetical protein VKP08_06795, partial [Anaerolineales bacterium]|nr:hypothetical protein [Anaerolineales bacterium]
MDRQRLKDLPVTPAPDADGQRQHHAHHESQAGKHGDQHAEHQPDHQHREVEKGEDSGKAAPQGA